MFNKECAHSLEVNTKSSGKDERWGVEKSDSGNATQ